MCGIKCWKIFELRIVNMNKPINPDAVILNTTHSPFARLKPVSINQISLEDDFWRKRRDLNYRVTIPSQFLLLEQTGHFDNFRRVIREVQKPYQGLVFNDSDVYKWLEAASWSMNAQQDGEISEMVEQVINLIVKAQDKDGYINTYFSLEKIRDRWMNLQEKHELYCAGHLIQAAIAHHRVTGSYRLLNVALRLADHICRTFGRSQVEGTSGHPEIEMALVELYRTTQEPKYLDQAAVFIDRRGRGLLGGSEYLLDHKPFRELDRLVGHAVRALYLCAGAADLSLETGENQLVSRLETLWHNMVTQHMYITGGVGSRYEGETFGLPYELPNARSYAETCAAIANLMWNWRMLHLKGSARFADLMEWTVYNAILPGISLEGKKYFYVNPLRDDGTLQRCEWFECACCPSNYARTIASFPGYMYSLSGEGIWIHLYSQSKVSITLVTGQKVNLEQNTRYPWDGKVRLLINEVKPDNNVDPKGIENDKFGLFMRIPGWVSGHVDVKINGKPYHHHASGGSYLEIQRQWKQGDKVDLDFPMHACFHASHPLVAENYHHLAITRGPLVYCIESADNPTIDISQIMINPSTSIESEYSADLLGGIVQLHMRGFTQPFDHAWSDHLYRPLQSVKLPSRKREVELISIPYFAWANRQPGKMSVWHKFQ
jgi:DUF1680 family protein